MTMFRIILIGQKLLLLHVVSTFILLKEFNMCVFDQDVTVIFRRRGGDDLVQNHIDWATTVASAPDVINMTFIPIVSLLDDVPATKYLARAIDLYLECKLEHISYIPSFIL